MVFTSRGLAACGADVGAELGEGAIVVSGVLRDRQDLGERSGRFVAQRPLGLALEPGGEVRPGGRALVADPPGQRRRADDAHSLQPGTAASIFGRVSFRHVPLIGQGACATLHDGRVRPTEKKCQLSLGTKGG